MTRDLGSGRPYRGVVKLFTGEIAKTSVGKINKKEIRSQFRS